MTVGRPMVFARHGLLRNRQDFLIAWGYAGQSSAIIALMCRYECLRVRLLRPNKNRERSELRNRFGIFAQRHIYG